MNITDIDTLVDEFSQHLADVLEDVPPIPTPLAHSIQHQVLVEWLRKTLTTQATTHQATLAEVVKAVQIVLDAPVTPEDIPPFPSEESSKSARNGFITGAAWMCVQIRNVIQKHSITLTDDKPTTL